VPMPNYANSHIFIAKVVKKSKQHTTFYFY
jgi:hypothetical protein